MELIKDIDDSQFFREQSKFKNSIKGMAQISKNYNAATWFGKFSSNKRKFAYVRFERFFSMV